MKEGTKSNLALGHFAAISVMYFTNSLSQTILFPFAAVMVSSFNVTDDPAKLGYESNRFIIKMIFYSIIRLVTMQVTWLLLSSLEALFQVHFGGTSCIFILKCRTILNYTPLLITSLFKSTQCTFRSNWSETSPINWPFCEYNLCTSFWNESIFCMGDDCSFH